MDDSDGFEQITGAVTIKGDAGTDNSAYLVLL
jgi:hypothetical protein